jgi:hypothetical protein
MGPTMRQKLPDEQHRVASIDQGFYTGHGWTEAFVTHLLRSRIKVAQRFAKTAIVTDDRANF